MIDLSGKPMHQRPANGVRADDVQKIHPTLRDIPSVALNGSALLSPEQILTLRHEIESLRNRLHEQTRANEEKTVLLAQAHERSESLQKLSVEDSLTGLFNRRHFDHRLGGECERAWRYGSPLSVAFADLDGFKAINDRHSHAMGDAVLRAVAELLSTMLRKSDLVARYGGDEFAILFPATSREAARVACEKIRKAVQAYPWETIAPGLSVTISIGLTDELATASPAQILAAADRLLYVAKREGRNQVH